MILFILYEFVSNKHKGASGGNISNYFLVENLRHHHKIGIIAPNIPKDLIAELEEKGVIVISEELEFQIPLRRLKKRQWIKATIESKLLNCPRTLAQIDIVVSSNGTCDLAKKLKSNDTKHYILCRAFEDFFSYNSFYPIKEKIKRLFIKILDSKRISEAYRNADKIITNSTYMKGFILSHYPETQTDILYPPIDIPLKKFNPLPLLPRVGIINPSSRKGEQLFLSLAKKFPALTFVYFSQHQNNYSSKNIEYAGWLSDREELFSSIDILIAPSVWTEPFGRVSVEAIRSGIPALVSNVGGLPETVDNDFIVCNQSIESWEAKLSWILTNSSEVEHAWNRSVLKSQLFEQEPHNRKALEVFSV